MPDIRYVCLSDMHLGEETSLLTRIDEERLPSLHPDVRQASLVLRQLVECIKELVGKNENQEDKPTLILNGDIIDLAMASDREGVMIFQLFMELLQKDGEPLFDKKIYYILGNHDHHLWETAREARYAEVVRVAAPADDLPNVRHITNLLAAPDGDSLNERPFEISLLTGLVQRNPHLNDSKIIAAYPNLGLVGEDGKKCIVFHHGHFTEPIYSQISQFQTLIFPDRAMPETVNFLEADNFAWIDFIWSTIGRSGDAGRDIETLYDMAQLEGGLAAPIENLAKGLAEKIGPHITDPAEAWIINRALKRYLVGEIKGLEKNVYNEPISPESMECLKNYVNGPLKLQMLCSLNDTMPEDFAFVFGHTHKPINEDRNDFSSDFPQWISLYNTGGWIFEQPEPRPNIGSAVVLVDENRETVSVRLHDEMAPNKDETGVRVEDSSTSRGKMPSPFYNEISKRIESIDKASGTFKKFSEIAAGEMAKRSSWMLVEQGRKAA